MRLLRGARLQDPDLLRVPERPPGSGAAAAARPRRMMVCKRLMEYVVKLARATGCPTAAVAARTTWDEFPMLWKTLLDDVWAFLRDTGLRAHGHNVMRYKDDVPNVEVGVQVTGTFTP